eukprot:Hpha_TRINITY_DN10636_c0_g1::TRINITY_DN10636_c0_g1_i1::g.156886::m.156886
MSFVPTRSTGSRVTVSTLNSRPSPFDAKSDPRRRNSTVSNMSLDSLVRGSEMMSRPDTSDSALFGRSGWGRPTSAGSRMTVQPSQNGHPAHHGGGGFTYGTTVVLKIVSEQVLDHSDFLATLEPLSERNQGLITQVLSSFVVVVWNAGRPCLNHVEQSASFMQRVANLSDSTHEIHGGVSSGPVRCGVVTGGRSWHQSVFGRAVELAMMMSEEAAACQEHSLMAGPVAGWLAMRNEACRAQYWMPTVGRPFIVWALTKVDDGEGDGYFAPSEAFSKSAMDEEANDAFIAAVKENNTGALSELISEGRTDLIPTQSRVVSGLSQVRKCGGVNMWGAENTDELGRRGSVDVGSNRHSTCSSLMVVDVTSNMSIGGSPTEVPSVQRPRLGSLPTAFL